ncbi:MAG TPA: hypothetical protein PKA48_08995, partial [Candidatus Obscuribacter sp.]|nr:hypothetical protein [Candidatus Obscuribacter sp.]
SQRTRVHRDFIHQTVHEETAVGRLRRARADAERPGFIGGDSDPVGAADELPIHVEQFHAVDGVIGADQVSPLTKGYVRGGAGGGTGFGAAG